MQKEKPKFIAIDFMFIFLFEKNFKLKNQFIFKNPYEVNPDCYQWNKSIMVYPYSPYS